MAPPEISKGVLDAKLEACRFAFSKLSAVRATRMKNYKQFRTLLMMKEIARRGADRDFLKDPENSVTRILCAVLKQVASNSNRSLKALRGFRFDSLDDEQKEPVSRMIDSIQGMSKERYEAEPIVHLDDMNEPMEMEIYLGNEEDSVGGEIGAIVRPPIFWPIEGQITVEWVESLMDLLNWFMWKNSVSELPLAMPHSVAVALVESASEILDKEDNCVKIECCNEGFRVIVVGDLRGHLHDLLKIFDDAGRPSENQCFVFNGNYIGRGSWSLEVFLVLLAWKILMPERVFLLRGYHETKVCAEEFGFYKDVCDRFGEHGDIVYTKSLDCFKVLPLASIIADIAYTTHGGLFRSIHIPQDQEKPQISLGSLEELNQVDRKLIVESEDNPVVLGDVLWSSPWMADGLVEINHKGRGVLWGHDCTETFLRQNSLKMVIRSHEGPDARADREDMGNMLSGYSLDHEVESGKLYSLFSASMFSQGLRDYENEGAYAVLEPPDYSEPKFISFTVENIPKAIRSNGSSPQPQQKFDLERKSSDFDAIGISSPPTWTVPLSGNAGRTFHLREPPEVSEGFPLPDTVEEPHKSNYDYLFKLVGALKYEIKTRDDRERKLMDQLKKMKGTLDVIGKMTTSL